MNLGVSSSSWPRQSSRPAVWRSTASPDSLAERHGFAAAVASTRRGYGLKEPRAPPVVVKGAPPSEGEEGFSRDRARVMRFVPDMPRRKI